LPRAPPRGRLCLHIPPFSVAACHTRLLCVGPPAHLPITIRGKAPKQQRSVSICREQPSLMSNRNPKAPSNGAATGLAFESLSVDNGGGLGGTQQHPDTSTTPVPSNFMPGLMNQGATAPFSSELPVPADNSGTLLIFCRLLCWH
jgi:hypothetical protein